MVYTVKQGDTLAKIAEAFLGDPRAYLTIARANGLDPNREIPAGTQLRIPSGQIGATEPLEEITVDVRRVPDPDAPVAPIETVTTTASRLYDWTQDWRVWLAGAVFVGGLIYLLSDE